MKVRRFVGLYSGAAADGVDAALVEIRGRGARMKVRHLCSVHVPYAPSLQRRVVAMMNEKVPPAALGELDRDVGEAFAAAADKLISQAGEGDDGRQAITAIGSSGQLMARVGARRGRGGAELVVGCPAVIASRSRLTVVSGFSAGDMAAGGCGGVVSAWPDWLMLADKKLSRVVLHLGGLVRLTFLGGGCLVDDVIAYDLGPGTTVMDELARRLCGCAFDKDGSIASGGKVSASLMNELLANPYFQSPPPKATDPSRWGRKYLWQVTNAGVKHGCGGADLVATVTEMIAQLAARAVGGLTERPHEVILSGGGAMNIHLAGRIRKLLSPSSTYAAAHYGLPLRAHRAVAHAVLAAARLDNHQAHCPLASGASRLAVLGAVVAP